jgi:methionyl-tRNA synthetase
MAEETPIQETPAQVSSQISIEDFARVQMRVGQILEAEKIEGSRKLVKLRVDIGSEVRQVVAGIAEAYEPASLVNKKIVIVANLKPAKLMGVESNGMAVAASVDGKPVLATFIEDVPNGALLK